MTAGLINADDIEARNRIPVVLDRLLGVQAAAEQQPQGRGDGLASFNYLYTVITRMVQADYLDGKFLNGDFITRLDVSFANRYLGAVDADSSTCPGPWRALIERRSDRWISPLVFAVAGVSAHVNYDLAFALVNTWEQRGVSETDFRDYQHLNDIFAREMQKLRDHLEDRAERRFERTFGLAPAENALGDITVFLARYLAWLRARTLWRHRASGTAISAAEQRLGMLVGVLNECILTGDGAIHRMLETLLHEPVETTSTAPAGQR